MLQTELLADIEIVGIVDLNHDAAVLRERATDQRSNNVVLVVFGER